MIDSADDPTDYCTDTDGGFDYLTKGTISGGRWYYTEATYTSYTDYCLDGAKITEYYCIDANHAHFVYKNCETVLGSGYTCSDGVCVSS